MRIGWPPPQGRGFPGELADAAQALQHFAERLLGLVLVKDEEHLFETRVTTLHVVDHGRHHRVGRLRGRDPADTAAQGRKGQGRQLVLLGDRQGGPGGGGDLFGIGLEVLAHGDRMDDVRRGQVPSDREHSLSDLDRPLSQRVFLDDDPAFALQGPGDSRAHQELVVCGVDHRVDFRLRDVASLDHHRRLPDLALHGRGPVPGRSAPSRAFTASHARSRSSVDASVTDRPPALISASTFPNRRVNFSEDRRRHSSASMPRSRATLTIENSRSPSSSATRSSSPASSASPASPISSWTLLQASCQRVQSKPTREALVCRRWARSSAGSAAGTPSRVEPARSLPEPSSCLICSHCASASRASATTRSPKTCGWRRVILAQSCPITSSIVNSPASAPSWQWNTTWNRRSPSSSTRWSREPSSMASRTSWASSRRYGLSDARVCSRSHGQPP